MALAAVSLAAEGGKFQKAHDHLYEGLTAAEEKEWTDPYFFIQMADCQLGMFDNDNSWEKEMALLEEAVSHINRLKPRFVIVCGDLTNAKPYQPAYPEQIADYKRVMSKISDDVPLVCLCGNHDVGNKPTRKKIAAYESHFGSHYFQFWVGGVHCLALNSSLIHNPKKAPALFEEQKEWIKTAFEAPESKRAVHRLVFTHHPWFLRNPHTYLSRKFEIPPERRHEMLQLFAKHRVAACFAGHFHRNSHGQYQGMEMITTSAIGKPGGSDPSGFRIVKVYEDRLEHGYFPLNEVPEAIHLDFAQKLTSSL